MSTVVDAKLMRLRLAVSLAFLAGLSACASVTPLQGDYSLPEPFPGDYLAEFCYAPTPLVEDLTLLREKRAYRVYTGVIHAAIDGFDDQSPITFEYYQQTKGTPAPVILLLPILNGMKDLMRPFAKLYARKGYAAVIIDTVQGSTLLDDLKDPEPALRQAVQRHRRVIDWAESRPELDASRVGVFGASLGGFNALYLAALDERIDAAAIALVGGSLSQVMVNSQERRIVEAVTGAKRDLGLDDAQLREYLDTRIESDPLMLARHVNAERMHMTLARRDKSVPYANQLELYRAMGQPESITLPTGHATTAAYLFYLRSSVLSFFDRKLAAGDDKGTAIAGPCSVKPPGAAAQKSPKSAKSMPPPMSGMPKSGKGVATGSSGMLGRSGVPPPT